MAQCIDISGGYVPVRTEWLGTARSTSAGKTEATHVPCRISSQSGVPQTVYKWHLLRAFASLSFLEDFMEGARPGANSGQPGSDVSNAEAPRCSNTIDLIKLEPKLNRSTTALERSMQDYCLFLI
jgi:hypothetical protein